MWKLALLGIALLFLFKAREGFSLQIKTDFGSFKGLPNPLEAASYHAKGLKNALIDNIPYRGYLRDLHRKLRRRKFL